MNADLNVEAFTNRVSPDTEEVFNEKFWYELDGVLNALDNVKARKYVDSKCVLFEKPLFESGTKGTICTSQVIIPYKTQCYSDRAFEPQNNIAACTLKTFPYLLHHCIMWARDYFE